MLAFLHQPREKRSTSVTTYVVVSCTKSGEQFPLSFCDRGHIAPVRTGGMLVQFISDLICFRRTGCAIDRFAGVCSGGDTNEIRT